MGPSGSQLPIDRERWLTILNQMGWGDTRLIELPPPELPTNSTEWQQVIKLLTEATSHLRAGNFETATEKTRETVEGVVAELAKHWRVPRGQGKRFEDWTKELGGRLEAAWPNDPDAARLLTGLLNTAWHWASEAHHYRTATAQRREAKFSLNLATDLIDFAGHLMSVHPDPVVRGQSPS